MADILEMLSDSLGDTYLTDGDAKSLHEFDGIVICTVGSTESRHRYSDDSLTVEAQLVESLYGNKKSKSRVETSADTYHSRLGIDMIESFGKTCHLDIKYLLTSGLHITTLRNERMGIDIPCKYEFLWGDGLSRDVQCMSTSLGIDECGVLTTLRTEFLDIYLTYLYLRLERETLTLGKDLSILEDHSIATIYHILGRLSETTAGIYISANGTSTLLGQQTTQIVMLANKLIAGREIEYDVGTCKGEIIAWRYGSPYVLAYLNTELHAIACGKEYRF